MAAVAVFAFLSPLFHQEVPKNTIRILLDKPLDERHFRLVPLLEAKKYTYVRHGDDFDLEPENQTCPTLQFRLVRDENTRALIFLKGEADVLYDSLSFAKTEWLRKQRVPEFSKIYSQSGEAVSQLAMNLENQNLMNPEIRKAIAGALPLKHWTGTIFKNWLEPQEQDNPNTSIPAIQLPIRITLDYLSTSSREGQQMAFLVREALEKIGITVKIHIFEPSLFYAKIRKREFDLYSSTTLPGTKNILDLPNTGLIPLFRWKHGLILNSRVIAPANIEKSLDYSFRFLSELQLQSGP